MTSNEKTAVTATAPIKVSPNVWEFILTSSFASAIGVVFTFIQLLLLLEGINIGQGPKNNLGTSGLLSLSSLIVALVVMFIFIIHPMAVSCAHLFECEPVLRYKRVTNRIIVALAAIIIFFIVLSIALFPLVEVGNAPIVLLLILINFSYDLIAIYAKDSFLSQPYMWIPVTVILSLLLTLANITCIPIIILVIVKTVMARLLFCNKTFINESKANRKRNIIILSLTIIALYLLLTFSFLEINIIDTIKEDPNTILAHLYNLIFTNITKGIGGTISQVVRQ